MPLTFQTKERFHYNWDLKKREDLRNSLVLLKVTVLWHVARWVSCVPPHDTLPALLDFKGSKPHELYKPKTDAIC